MDELTNYEKMIESVNQLAGLIHAYYLALVESGFTKTQALALTISYQDSLMDMAQANRGGES